MNKFLLLLFVLVLFLGCARIKMEAPKEAIKVDVAMRLDVYQHVEKDIDKIENMVSDKQGKKPSAKDNHSLLECFVGNAYAEDGLGVDVEQAALRRKDRLSELAAMEEKGIIGENKSGLVEIKNEPSLSDQGLVEAENSDRMIIYKAVAEKNGTSVDDVQHLYAKRLQADAPAGTPVEDESSGWRIK